MRNRWIITGLLVAAGLLTGPVGSARAEPTAWDVSGNEEFPVWAPIGTYQHDGSGWYTGCEFMIMHTQRIVGDQLIAVRGLVLTTGTPSFPGGASPLTPAITGFPPGTFLGSGEEALRSGDLGRSTWQPGYRVTLGYRMENGWNFSVSYLHLFEAKYSGAAGVQGPNFSNPGGLGQNTFLFAPVYNYSPFFVGQNPFPPIPFFVNPTSGIWNGASDMTILFTQRFDNWDLAGRFPVFETENARTYAIAGGRFSWLWERFEWRTSKPTLITDGVSFQFQESPDSAARYINTLSQRMYGPMVGIAPRRSAPASWSCPPRAMPWILPTSSSTRRACSTIAWPRGVAITSFLLRSKSRTPSSSSSFASASESVGCVTKHFRAARPKCRSCARATTYLSSVRVTSRTP